MADGFNQDIGAQGQALERILFSSQIIRDVLDRARSLDIGDYYIGAGCIAQTVWNHLSGNPPDHGIKDIDFAYFDDTRLDYESENEVVEQVKRLCADIELKMDVKNQARVHVWYKDRFGYEIAPYGSLEAALNSWPTTATAIGVRREKHGGLKIYAPFGLNDVFGKIVRANKAQITERIYTEKARRWLTQWPDLKIIPWDR